MRSLVIALVVLALAVASAGAATGEAPAVAPLTLDGETVYPELALTSGSRARGLMHRPQAPADGMLFVFSEPTRGSFWMKNTLVPLTIVFFDSSGRRVRRLSMVPCLDDPCPLYRPGRPYRFALELGDWDPRPAWRLGPVSALRRLIARAK